MSEPFIVVSDISSVQRLLDAVKTAFSFGVKTFIAAKVYGAAAANGVPEAMKLAIRMQKNFIVLNSAREAVELFEPEKVLVFSFNDGTKLSMKDLSSKLKNHRKLMLIFSGSDVDPEPRVLSLGEPVYFAEVPSKLPTTAEIALALLAAKLG